jgi:outer membrane protein assembly factor BamB
MNSRMVTFVLVVLAAGAVHAAEVAGGARGDVPADAGRILAESGVTGGLLIHLPCGDGALTAALGRDQRFLVQGLDRDPSNVQAAQRRIRDLGLGGRVSADRLEGEALPYVDDLANVAIISDPAASRVAKEEVLRVLAPGGVAMIGGQRIVKARPAEIDDWTHWLHGPDGNAVSQDTRVGVSRSLQWMGSPRWAQHHNMQQSVSAMVSAHGRIYAIVNEAPISVQGLPDKWFLIARDAFNGLELWRKPIADWGWRKWTDQQFSKSMILFPTAELMARRLVAGGDVVYATLGWNEPIAALDGTTGDLLRKYPGTEGAREFLFKGGLIAAGRQTGEGQKGWSIVGVDAKAGQVVWQKSDLRGTGKGLYLTWGDQSLFCLDGSAVVALDATNGRELWRAANPLGQNVILNPSLSFAEGVLILGHTDRGPRSQEKQSKTSEAPVTSSIAKLEKCVIGALDPRTGKAMWQNNTAAQPRFGGNPVDFFVARGLVWVGDEKGLLQGLDVRTGEVRKTFPILEIVGAPHHHRCYRDKATVNYLLSGRHGLEYSDFRSGAVDTHWWLRGQCRYGIMPANGLIYVTAHSCGCHANAKLSGFFALSARPPEDGDVPAPQPEPGPAPAGGQGRSPAGPEDWPSYKHDARRGNRASTEVPGTLSVRWRAMPGGAPGAPVVACGGVFVGSTETGEVQCLDAATGTVRWRFTADGPVDTPPTYHRGRVIFGSRGGSVYALDAASGQAAWRLRAAHKHLRLMAFGRLESPWPLNGAVLVMNDKVYCLAGRSMHLDGGLYAYEIESETGKPVQRARLQANTEPVGETEGAMLPDILCSDGKRLYLRGMSCLPNDLSKWTKGEHLSVADGGLLDGAWNSSAYWRYRNVNARNLVFDAGPIVGIRWSRKYTLFSCEQDVFTAGAGYELFAVNAAPGAKETWNVKVRLRARAMALTGEYVVLAGAPDVINPQDPLAVFEDRGPGVLALHRRSDGGEVSSVPLEAPPVHDGMAVAGGRAYLALANGAIVCLAGK